MPVVAQESHLVLGAVQRVEGAKHLLVKVVGAVESRGGVIEDSCVEQTAHELTSHIRGPFDMCYYDTYQGEL